MMALNDPLDRAARDFLLRRQTSNDDVTDGAAPLRNSHESLLVDHVWALSGMIAEEADIRRLRDEALAPPPEAIPHVVAPPPRWPARALLAAAAAALVLIGGSLVMRRPDAGPDVGGVGAVAAIQPTVSTPVATRRIVSLPDGSTVTLDARSTIRVAFSPHERRVFLAEGRGYFDVRHEARPFVVSAGSGEVLDLGTRFVVDTSGSRTSVSLVEGKVEVRASVASRPVALRPGETISYARGGAISGDGARAGDPLDWTTGKLTFDQAPLADAVRTLSRYTAQPIVIDAQLARHDRHVTGVFLTRSSESFADTLAAALDLKVVQQADGARRLEPK